MRSLARDLVSSTLALSGITAPRRFGRDRLNIVTFHRVLPKEQRDCYPYPMLAVTPEELASFLDFFRESFICTTLAGAWHLFSLEVTPERPLLALTFDDAQLDNFLFARPLLASRDLRASFYVPVEAVDRQEPLWHDRLGFADRGDLVEQAKSWSPEERARRVDELGSVPIPEWAKMMSWDQIRTLAFEGHEIGSHSLTHALLPQLDEAGIQREVAESKARIEDRIDRTIETFCYPNGDADDRSAAAVEGAGYACAVTTEWGNNDRSCDPFRLRRCDMNPRYSITRSGKFSAALVAWRMSGLHPGLRF